MPNQQSARHTLPHLNGDRFARSCEPLSKRQRTVRNISVCVLAVSALLLVGCGASLTTTPNFGSPNGTQRGSPTPSPSPTPNPDPSPTPSPSAQCNGTGLAATDVSGQCRTSPTTMGAFEADEGTGTTSASVASLAMPQTASRSLQISWSPLGNNTTGYMVYFGRTADTANVFVSDLPLNSGSFNPSAPAVTYDSARDLGLYAGDTACFRIFAYDMARALSSQSTLLCTAV